MTTTDTRPDEIVVPAGKLVVFSTGEYSDYQHAGHFVVLENITRGVLPEVIDECKKLARAENAKNDYGFSEEYGADGYFIPALIRRGLILDVTCIEIHYGSYGELELAI